MKKFSYIWIALGMAFFLLLLPIYSMAQTQLKLRLMTETGDYITTNEPQIKNFFMSSDGTLAVILSNTNGSLSWTNFTFAQDETHIGIRNGSSTCTISEGTVTATVGNTFSFEVYSSTANATIVAPALPARNWTDGASPRIYQWKPESPYDIGTFLAVFEASAPDTKPTQIVVMIKIVSQVQYTLTTQANPAAGGTVTGAATYNGGTQAQVRADANTGYTFTGWSGDASGITNPLSVTMDRNKTIVANFTPTTPTTYNLTVNINPTGAGTVSPPTGSYAANSTLTLTATENAGYTFSSWSGVDSSNGNTATVTMNANRTVIANFTTGSIGQIGSKGNPVVLNKELGPNNLTEWGYNWNKPAGEYKIPRGQSVWFKIDPTLVTMPSWGSMSVIKIRIINYQQESNGTFTCYRVNRRTLSETLYGGPGTWYSWSRNVLDNTADYYYLIELKESGVRDTPMSIWWYF